jgi:16S rRNA (guanine527-N7)-methyltransferase
MTVIEKYFPDLTDNQRRQYAALFALYADWNSKVNLISRKDVGNLYERHILHSLGIAEVIRFRSGSAILDVGAGGGFPGIPLAIRFPEVDFVLIDSVGKKIKIAANIAQEIGLHNVECRQKRVEEERQTFDFVVSRAAMPLPDLVRVCGKNIDRRRHKNALPNGYICLKGGDLRAELQIFRQKVVEHALSDYFEEEFFSTKKVVYLPA